MKISVHAFGKGPKAYIRKGRKTMKTKTRYAKHLHFLEIALLLGVAVFLASGAAALGSRDAIADNNYEELRRLLDEGRLRKKEVDG